MRGQEPEFTPEALMGAIRERDPEVRFVLPRVLRRVIKKDRNLTGALVQVPHRKSLVIERVRLLPHVLRTELGLVEGETLPEVVILLPRPLPRQIESRGREGCLLHWWRLLFHARVHAALESTDRRLKLHQFALRERIDGIGQTAFDEVRRVLSQEHFLLPPKNDFTDYVEFVAIYTELRYFAPSLLPKYFPTISDPQHIDEVLSRDLNSVALLAATRPAGAPDPGKESIIEEPIPRVRWRGSKRDSGPQASSAPQSEKAERKVASLRQSADRRRESGNVVRAALLRQKAEFLLDPEVGEKPSADARRDLERLTTRLRDALELDKNEASIWHDLLSELLPRAAIGFRGKEARLLYDLQKVCVDHERGVHALGLLGYLFRKKPLQRRLPFQREVMICRHLRAALRRLPSVRIAEERLLELTEILTRAEEKAEQRLRGLVGPVLEGVLTKVGLLPTTVPERVARDRLEEELLDRIVERGFLSLGDLRDAVSRNQLKLDDCKTFVDFWSADHLLEADLLLRDELDGIYRRGEVYMRALQRASALSFGTDIGRKLTRFVFIPFGGAYLALEGLQHMLHAAVRALFGIDIMLRTWWSLLLVGFWFLGLMHVQEVRRLSANFFGNLGRGLRNVFYTWPRALAHWPPWRQFLESRGFRRFSNFILKPALFAALFWIPLAIFRSGSGWIFWSAGGLFLAFNFFLNSPLGAAVEEWFVDLIARGWDQVKTRLIVSVVRFVLDLFRRATEALEQFLYAIDEWLRFRTGQNRATLFAKAGFGAIWRGLNYAVRLYVTLLIEPQVNPIKHFPVVTVTHKMTLPFYPQLISAFNVIFAPLGRFLGEFMAWATVILLPGLFGFMVWEFKENWRLYAANRARTLRPEMIGHHGETMLRLMKPGFHSGTLPKYFAKLRRVERRRRIERRPVGRRKILNAIHHCETAVFEFFERNFIALLMGTKTFREVRFHVASVEAGSNRIRVKIEAPTIGPDVLEFSFDEQSGKVVAGILNPGWIDHLDTHQREVFRCAMLGLYKAIGVELVREDIERTLGSPPPPYDISDVGLVVWPGPGFEDEVVYALKPKVRPGARPGQHLLFPSEAISFETWTEVWDAEASGQPLPELLPRFAVLPVAKGKPV